MTNREDNEDLDATATHEVFVPDALPPAPEAVSAESVSGRVPVYVPTRRRAWVVPAMVIGAVLVLVGTGFFIWQLLQPV